MMNRDASFPTLVSVNYFKTLEDSDYWNRFGLEKCIPSESEFPLLYAGWNEICRRFNQKYAKKRIGMETMETWQNLLQEITDANAPIYERALRLYSQYAEKIESEIVSGTVRTQSGNSSDSGNSTSTAVNQQSGSEQIKSVDTPYTEVNLSDSYADAVQKSENTGNSTGSGTGSYSDSKTFNTSENIEKLDKGGFVEALNSNLGAFRVPINAFLEQYQSAFLQIFW